MIKHRSHHWIAVALVILLALLVLRDVHGQTTSAAAVFEGRPALAGAVRSDRDIAAGEERRQVRRDLRRAQRATP